MCAPCNPSGLHKLRLKLTAHPDWPLNGDDFAWSSARSRPVHRKFRSVPITRMLNRDDMKCSEKSYQQQFTRPTRQLADDKSRLPASTYGAGTRWSSRKIASSRAMEKALARMPVRSGRRASALSLEAEFATNAGRRDYELSKFTSRIHDVISRLAARGSR